MEKKLIAVAIVVNFLVASLAGCANSNTQKIHESGNTEDEVKEETTVILTNDITYNEQESAEEEPETEKLTDEQASLIRKYPVNTIKYAASDYSATFTEYQKESFYDSAVEKEMTVNILGVEYTADYDDSKAEADGRIADHFRRYDKTTGQCSLTIRRDDKALIGFIIPNDRDLLSFQTEDQLLETVDAYLPGSIDRSQYVCQILTGYAEVSEYGVEKKAELGFRRMTEEDRAPEYEVHLIKDYYGFPTGDQMRFVISERTVFFRLNGDPNPDGFYEKAAALALQDEEIVEEYMRSSFEKNPYENLVKIQRISNVLFNCDGKPAVLVKVRYSAVSTVEPATDADGNAVPFEATAEIVLIPDTD